MRATSGVSTVFRVLQPRKRVKSKGRAWFSSLASEPPVSASKHLSSPMAEPLPTLCFPIPEEAALDGWGDGKQCPQDRARSGRRGRQKPAASTWEQKARRHPGSVAVPSVPELAPAKPMWGQTSPDGDHSSPTPFLSSWAWMGLSMWAKAEISVHHPLPRDFFKINIVY